MGQRGFRDEEQRIQKLQDKKPVLVLLSAQIPWDTFLALLDRGYSQERNLPWSRVIHVQDVDRP